MSDRARAAQDRALATYVRRQVYPYSAFYRERLDAAGIGRRVGRRADLDRLAPVRFEQLADPEELVLRPDEESVQRFGRPGLIARVFWAKLWRRPQRVNVAVIDPMYKPVHWHVQRGFPVAYSAEDLDRLAELGRQWLERAGLSRYDTVVSVLRPGPNLPYWELVLGCQRAGLSALHLPPLASPAQVAAASPSVLAGRPADLERLLRALEREGRPLSVHTLLAVGRPPDAAVRRRLRALVAGAPLTVVAAWAPPGVRALWTECRDGGTLHTSPSTEVLQVRPPGRAGQVVWTGIGWKGTAFLRLATEAYGTIEDEPCPGCGRPGARLRLPADEPSFVDVLESTPGLTGWQAEIRTVDGHTELVVFLALDRSHDGGHPGALLRRLDQSLSATQYVVVDRDTLAARLAAAEGRQVVDLRETEPAK